MNSGSRNVLEADSPSEDAQPARDKYAGFNTSASRQFADWLAQTGGSLAFTTYQAGRVFFIGSGSGAERRVTMFERYFNRAMGLAVQGETLWLASLYQLWRFDNAVPAGGTWGERKYDRATLFAFVSPTSLMIH